MDKQQKIVILVLAILLALVTLAVIIVAALGTNRAGKFDPPPFEENAVAGVPDPLPSAFGTITVNPGFVVGACAYPSLEGSELGVYLTSHKNNTCWVKIQIYDEEKTSPWTKRPLTAGRIFAHRVALRGACGRRGASCNHLGVRAGKLLQPWCCQHRPRPYNAKII